MRRHATALPVEQSERWASILKPALPHTIAQKAMATLFAACLFLALGTTNSRAAAPTISSTSVSAVTATAAVLEAKINPAGEATTYHFEYGLADCSVNPCSDAPTPDANVGAGSSAISVTQEISDLEAGTKYHYLVVATNGTGSVKSVDRTFSTYRVPAVLANCPNQGFRVGPARVLPDCRAYELVSPLDKRGGDAVGAPGFNTLASQDQSSTSGEQFTYASYKAYGDSQSAAFGSQYIATRGTDGWSNHGISPTRYLPLLPGGIPVIESEFKAFSSDLSTALVWHNSDPPLTPDAAEGFTGLYTRNNLTESYTALTAVQPPIVLSTFDYPEFNGFTDDGSHVVFRADDALTTDAPSGKVVNLFLWANGELRLVSIFPDGTPNLAGSSAGTASVQIRSGHFLNVQNALSADGSRVYWSSDYRQEAPIYLRVNAAEPQSALGVGGECIEPIKACTIPVSETVSSGPAHFWAADPEGETAIFSMGPNLYKFNLATKASTLIAGQMLGAPLGVSNDAEWIYFASTGVLSGPNGEGFSPTAGLANVYLFHEGNFQFVSTLVDADTNSTSGTIPSPIHIRPIRHIARVTPDGRHLAFTSAASLATSNFPEGYDNTDAKLGTSDREVYIYDAEAERLSCASCNPSGARPVGGLLNLGAKGGAGDTVFAAAIVIPWETQLYATRALSDDGGRLFFNSRDSLVPQDTNGLTDVYQWEKEGHGSCEEAGGCVSLISTGKSVEDSEFVDATPSGSDVFIRTAESIDPRDPGLSDVYDVRVNGGFALPFRTAVCEGEACQTAPAIPADTTPASSVYSGPGNAKEKRARSKPRKKRHKKKRHVKRDRSGHGNRGGNR